MPLSFLVPAVLVGLLAIGIPVLVHLTRKQKAKVEPFPSLMFLERVPYQAESRRRIHHWLLLALRALAVVLIVLAFARPFVNDAEVSAGAGSGPTELVVLVDRSYSMAVADHWERALEAARSRLSELGPLDRASLVFFDGGAEVAVRSSSAVDRFTAALDTATLSDRATRYGPGLKLAETILDESELPGRELVVIGDFQRAGWTGDEGVRLPPGTTITTVALAEEAPENRAVSRVELGREVFQGQERVTPTARVVRTGGEEVVEVEAVLEIDGREVERRTVELPASGAETVTFEPFTLAARHTRGAVRIDEDALPADDAFHFVASPGRALDVLVLDDARPGSASSLFLQRALGVTTEGGFAVTVRRDASIGPELLDETEVVIVNDRAVPAELAARLRSFVEGGGGLLLVLGERGSWPADAVGLLPGAPGPATDRTDARGGRLGQVDYGHPVFEVFRGPRSGDFTSARFLRARGLQIAGDSAVSILARYDDGSPALAERRVGDGRVLVWTSTLDSFWNDLALQPVFLPFVHQLVRHTSGTTEALPAFTAGQVIDVSDARAMETAGLGEAAAVLADGEERVALTPSGATLPLDPGGRAVADAGEGAAAAAIGPRFLGLEERGFYLVRPPGADDVRPLAVAVNVDLSESDLTPLDTEEVVATIAGREGTERTATGGVGGALEVRLEEQERRQSLWRFLLLGAFALLALETILSNRLSGRRAATAAAGSAGS